MKTQKQIDKLFLKSCAYGDLKNVQYTLTSTCENFHANIHLNNDMGLKYACTSDHLEVVKYLLTGSDLTEHADLHSRNDEAMTGACRHGHLEVVRYLVSSPELKSHANIYQSQALIWSHQINKPEKRDPLLNFFLYDMNMQLNDEIKKQINKYMNKDGQESIIQSFEKRDLFFSLSQELDDIAIKSSKMKI